MNKTVMVTGASSGIGAEVCRYLDSCGYRVIMVARNEQKMNELKSGFVQDAQVMPCDLTDFSAVDTLFTHIKDSGFKLNGLVHCAGAWSASPVRSMDVQEAEDMMHLNCFSLAALCQNFIRRGIAQENSSIVAFSSLSVKTCYEGTASYSMTKCAVDAFCKVLSKEVLRRHIRVNTIMPGYVRTPMTEGVEETNDVEAQQPFGIIPPVDVAYLVEFLLSDKSSYITGTSIPISGGMNF